MPSYNTMFDLDWTASIPIKPGLQFNIYKGGKRAVTSIVAMFDS